MMYLNIDELIVARSMALGLSIEMGTAYTYFLSSEGKLLEGKGNPLFHAYKISKVADRSDLPDQVRGVLDDIGWEMEEISGPALFDFVHTKASFPLCFTGQAREPDILTDIKVTLLSMVPKRTIGIILEEVPEGLDGDSL